MESNYRNEDFEHYIKQNADQYRMFPSDKVWKGINNALHTRRKWYGFWLGFLLLATGGAVTWVMTTQPASRKGTITFNSNLADLPANNTINLPEKKSLSVNGLLPFDSEHFTPGTDYTGKTGNNSNDLQVNPGNKNPGDLLEEIPVLHYEHFRSDKILRPISNDINARPVISSFDHILPAITEKTPDDIAPVVKTNAVPTEDLNSPYTIESVTNSYSFIKPAKKISWQLFITPTVSYRRLSVNKSSDNTSAFNYPFASLADVNNAVIHKPDLGLQIGLSGRYPITNSLKLRGGVQFNINRYDIKAYAFNGEVATIDLNGGNGNNSISTWTNYRNYAGYKSDWLKNYYVSISVPIGAEVKVVGNNKTNVGVAGTIQPTYILKDRAYLISTDYKNYAEVPRLVRHVNLNTSFETFVNYTNGKTKWQIGPQVRYQILSSFHNNYPIKENLFDFGVKLGVTLNE